MHEEAPALEVFIAPDPRLNAGIVAGTVGVLAWYSAHLTWGVEGQLAAALLGLGAALLIVAVGLLRDRVTTITTMRGGLRVLFIVRSAAARTSCSWPAEGGRFLPRAVSFLPWSSFRAVELQDDQALVAVDGGTLRLGPPLRDWRRLAERIVAHLADTPPPAGDLSEQTIEGWLGVPRYGSVTLTRDPAERRAIVVVYAAACVLALCGTTTLNGPAALWPWLRPQGQLGFAAVALLGGLWLNRRLALVQGVVTGAGLRLRQRGVELWQPWSSVLALRRYGDRWLVRTLQGVLVLERRWHGVEPVLRALNEVVGARRAGQVAGCVLPTGALSPAGRPAAPGPDLGLSPAHQARIVDE